MSTFIEKLELSQSKHHSLLCVGLDPDPTRFPDAVGRSAKSIVPFNRAIIEATSDLACCYKPNLGFYLPYGTVGLEALIQVRRDVPQDIPVILDAKVGDVGSTSQAYARAYFEAWGFDAVTAQPYLGRDSLQPLLDYIDRGVFILTKTSNPGAGLLQDRLLDDGTAVSQEVARNATDWNENNNVGLVVGATYPDAVRSIREIAPRLPFLSPGIGAQSGDPAEVIRAGLDANGGGLVVNASRSITYASSAADFQDAARQETRRLRDLLEAARAKTQLAGSW